MQYFVEKIFNCAAAVRLFRGYFASVFSFFGFAADNTCEKVG